MKDLRGAPSVECVSHSAKGDHDARSDACTRRARLGNRSPRPRLEWQRDLDEDAALQGLAAGLTLAPRGAAPTIGARLILTKALHNRVAQFGKPAGALIGSAEVICTIVSESRAQCSVTAHVPDGEIVAMGVIRLTNGLTTSRFAIVGGAGAYASSSGTVDTRDVSETHSLVTLNIKG